MGDQALNLTPRECLDTGCTVDIFTRSVARINIGDDGLAATALRIEIGVEYAGLAGELKLPGAIFAEVLHRIAEYPHQLRGIAAKYPLKPHRICHRLARYGDRLGNSTGTACNCQRARYRNKFTHPSFQVFEISTMSQRPIMRKD